MTTPSPEPFRDLDWDPKRARAFADRTVDLWQELLERLGDEELFAYLREVVFEHSTFPGHPRFMAYVSGAGTVPGAAADLLAAGMNMNAGGSVPGRAGAGSTRLPARLSGGLSICCFRYLPADLPASPETEAYLNVLNERLMTDVQQDGRVFISNAELGDRNVLRACIVNFRTEAEDLDAVLDVTAEIGVRLDAELRPDSLKEGAA